MGAYKKTATINQGPLYPHSAPLALGFLLQAKTCLLTTQGASVIPITETQPSITKAVFWCVSASAPEEVMQTWRKSKGV